MARLRCRPRPFDGRIPLFRFEQQPSPDLFEPDAYLGWNGAARDGIEIHEVPGRHGEHPNEPNVRVLAEKLPACIAAVETASCKT